MCKSPISEESSNQKFPITVQPSRHNPIMAYSHQDLELKRPDSAGRITLGKEFAGKTFTIQHQPNGDILLSPVVVLHEREAWLHQNQDALKDVEEGIEQSAKGDTKYLGSFSQYLDEDKL
jgi:hypothetical protein